MNLIMPNSKKRYEPIALKKASDLKIRASMMDLALLLKQCGTSEVNTKEMVSFVDDMDDETGDITTVKVVL